MEDNLRTIDLLSLRDLGANFTKGLDTITRAIHETEDIEIVDNESLDTAIKKNIGIAFDLKSLSIHQRNQLLAGIVREKCVKDGFMPAWVCLAAAAPNMGLDSRLVEDVRIAANVYERLKTGSRGRAPIDIKMSIGSQATYDSINRIGPKSLGGTAWRASEEYKAFLNNPAWSDAGYSQGIPPILSFMRIIGENLTKATPLKTISHIFQFQKLLKWESPANSVISQCVAMGWIGVQMKVTPLRDAPEVVRLQLLGTVDFDLDHLDDNQLGFQSGFDAAMLHTRAVGTKLQGAALIGMLNYDLQYSIRPIQNQWAASNDGPFNLGPSDVSPQDWASYLSADCAALVPFAFDENYSQSRAGMVNGMIHLQCQDLIFDTGCSNRVATVPYVEAAGVAKYGIHAAYSIAAYEATAGYFLKLLLESPEDRTIPPFGYSACVVAGPWGPFGTRYRVWERCVKYIKNLKLSKHPEAKALLELCSGDLMLKDYDLRKDVGDEWARAMQSKDSDLIPRPAARYFIPVLASELFSTPGVEKPKLCKTCAPIFERVMASTEKEEIHAMEGLPSHVTTGKFSRPASLAAGLRRGALWASGEHCCNDCASRIGFWADAAAYSVLTALMASEPFLGPSMWMMQNYFVGCVAFWPIGLPFLLSGFDLLADLSFETGAMGARDVVDI